MCFGCHRDLPFPGQDRETGLELLGMPALPNGIRTPSTTKKPRCWPGWRVLIPAFLSRQRLGGRSVAELEVRRRVLRGLILAFSYTVFSFLTQNVWTANTDGLADTTNRPANITHTRRGEHSPTSWPSGGVYKTAKWKPKDLSLIPPVKSSRFLLATSHLISINKSWPSSPNLAKSCNAEA